MPVIRTAVAPPAARRRGGIPPYIPLLIPAVAFMLLVYAFPFLSSIVTSFLDQQGVPSLSNYRRTVDLYARDIIFTLVVSVSNTAGTILLAIALAAYLRVRNSRMSRFIGHVYKLGIFIPFVVVAQMMRTFLAPHGLLNVTLARTGFIDIDSPLQLFNFSGLTFGFMWKLVPFAILIIYGGFQMIDNSYLEAARSTGAGFFAMVARILVPMNKSSILVATVLVYAQIVSCFTLPYMLLGGRTPTTITVDIAHRVTYFRDYGSANSLGVISYALVLVAAAYYLKTSVRQYRQGADNA